MDQEEKPIFTIAEAERIVDQWSNQAHHLTRMLHNAEGKLVQIDNAYHAARQEVQRLQAEVDTMKADLEAAAGLLVVPLPEPGTDMARVLIANSLMRQENGRLQAELDETTTRLRWLIGPLAGPTRN